MASSPISEVLPSDDVYRKFILDTLQEYTLSELEDALLWGAMRSDFKNWTGDIWERINGSTWSKIRKCCIPRGVWIDEAQDNATRSEILLQLFSTKYDDDLMDWDMKRIKQVEKAYGTVSRGIQYRKQELLGNIPDESQTDQFQNIPFQSPTPQQPEAEPISYPTVSKPSPFLYRPHQSQLPPKQDPHPTCISNPAPPTSKFRPTQALSIKAQPAPTRISNPAPSTSKIRKDCECIPERSTAQKFPTQAPSSEAAQVQAPSAQVLPVQAPSIQVLPAQVPSIPASSLLAPSVPAHLTQVLPAEQATSTKETVTPDKDVTSEEFVTPVNVVTSEQVVTPEENSSASQKAEASHHWATYHPHYKEKLGMTKSAHNPLLVRPPPKLLSLPGDWSDCVGKFATYHPHYKETPGMTKSAHDPFVLRPPPELSSLLGASSDYKDKIMKSPYDIKAGNHRFTIYHPHYKDKIVINPTRTFVCAADYLYFGCSLDNLGNLSGAFFFAHNSGTCAVEPDIITKKGKPSRTALDLSHPLQPPSLVLRSTLSEIRSAIFEYLAMPQYAPVMSKWQFSSTLANFPSLADYSSIELTSEASLNLSRAAQTAAQIVEFSPDDQALLNKQLQWQITNKSRGLRYDPRDTHLLSQIGYAICLPDATNNVNIMHWYNQITRDVLSADLYAMVRGLDIEKRHWGRYEIMRKKSCQHQDYGNGRMGKHEIGNDGTSEHKHLAIFKRVASVAM